MSLFSLPAPPAVFLCLAPASSFLSPPPSFFSSSPFSASFRPSLGDSLRVLPDPVFSLPHSPFVLLPRWREEEEDAEKPRRGSDGVEEASESRDNTVGRKVGREEEDELRYERKEVAVEEEDDGDDEGFEDEEDDDAAEEEDEEEEEAAPDGGERVREEKERGIILVEVKKQSSRLCSDV